MQLLKILALHTVETASEFPSDAVMINQTASPRHAMASNYEGYQNIIELLEGNNVVPLRSDTIRLVQNECSFHELRSEDPNQHLKDFLKLVDSLDLHHEIDHAAGGKLRDKSAEVSWEIIENLALDDNKREEVSKLVTKYVNVITFVKMENDKGIKSDEVVDKNIVEPIEFVEKEEAMNDEKDDESDRSVNEDSTRGGKNVDTFDVLSCKLLF
ncbi:hypothetical protein Tco_0574344 [Tanacetum coccineum]